MAQSYTATAKQNPGRKSWLVEFRHPLRNDGNDKAGKKTRKGLGTSDAARAQLLVSQLNELLAERSLWSLGAKPEAAKRYEPEVIEIFYGGGAGWDDPMRTELLLKSSIQVLHHFASLGGIGGRLRANLLSPE